MQRILQSLSLFVLIAVAILRPLVAESYDSAGNSVADALVAVSEPSPPRTLVFDALIVLAACGWLTARALGPARPYQRTGLEWGGCLVAAAVLISCLFAGNKRLAINASLDWLCALILAIVLAQLLTSNWHRRLLVAAILATTCVQAVECYDQFYFGYKATQEEYDRIKPEFWAEQGVDLDSAKVDMFERRIHAREASGFLPHSNITGSYLVLCGIAGLGLTWARWRAGGESRRRFLFALCLLLAVLVLSAVALTKSLGAMLACALGLATLVVVAYARPWIDRHRRAVFAGAWVVVVVGAFAYVGHGLYHNAFPHMSLTFRWQYWRASAEMIADHPWTGVGRENFGRHYLQYKAIESPEEVANPHNLLVQAAADWGLLGLFGIVVLLFAGSRRLTQPAADHAPLNASRSPPRAFSLGVWTVGLIFVITVCRWPLLDSNNPSFLYYTTVTGALIWLVAFLLFAPRRHESAEAENGADQPLLTAITVAVFAFVLHDLINFAFFVPATVTTFFALYAAGVAKPESDDASPARAAGPRRWLAPVLSGIVVLAVLVFIVRPVARVARLMALARGAESRLESVPLTARPAFRYYTAAAEADPLDPTPCVRRGRWLAEAAAVRSTWSDEAMALATESMGEAVRRDPYSVSHRRDLSRLNLMWAQLQRSTGSDPAPATGTEQFAAAVSAAKEAVRLYPRDPHGFVELGDCLLMAGEATRSANWILEAIDSYEQALELDDARMTWETIRRFRDHEKAGIARNLDRARSILDDLG